MIKAVNLQLTRRCNRKCSHCYGDYGPDTSGDLTMDQAKYYIDQLSEHETKYLNLTGGEPTLYKNLMEVIEYADKKRKQTGLPEKIMMITNGTWTNKEDGIQYLTKLKKAGMDNVDFSKDELFRKKQDTQNMTEFEKILDANDSDRNENLPKISILYAYNVRPVRRGHSISKELWAKRRTEAGKFKDVCSIDWWSFYMIGEDAFTTATVSPTGLYLCGCVPETIRIGNLGEPLSVIEPRVRKAGKFIMALAAFDPKAVADVMRDNYNDIPEAEHDCIACKMLFDDMGFGYIEKILEDGSFEKVIDTLKRRRKEISLNCEGI